VNLGFDLNDINSKYTINSKLKDNSIKFIKCNLEDRVFLPKIFEENKIDIVCNLAAQAGVRYSIENPNRYVDTNVVGFLNVLECCRNFNIKRIVYASSSSVYGNHLDTPYSESQQVDKPVSLYAATKKSNELMAHVYSELYNIETIGLRFFTVYGPFGRPDMAPMLFANAIFSNNPIKVFNGGNLSRDFTYIDDIIEGVVLSIFGKLNKNYQIFNIGRGEPINLLEFIDILESEIGIKANKIMMSMQPGDVNKTLSDCSSLANSFNYAPKISFELGIKNFIKWYKNYYNLII
jgi:UDP-glucuronate 4-epimerase